MQIIGHRGARGEAPENTLGGFQYIHDFEHIEVEVKAVATMAEAEKLVIELQKQLHGFEQIAVITSFDLKIHQALKQQYSIFKRGLLVEDDIKHQAIEQALELSCCQIGWMNQLATDEIIQATQQAHLQISVWTVNNVERAKHLQSLGIDGLITDFPKMMLEQL